MDPPTTDQQLQARIAELEEQASQMQASFDVELAAHKAKFQEGMEGQLLQALRKAAGSGTRGTKVDKPDRYDGSIDKYNKFISEVELVFQSDRTYYEDLVSGDHNKIIYALSLLKDGRASQWSRNFLKKYRTEDGFVSYTWKKFEQELSLSFADHNPTSTAITKIKSLSMVGRTAEEYITDFEIYEDDTGYNGAALIDILKEGLHDRLVSRIYDLAEMPKTLQDWKDWARKLDRQYRERRKDRRLLPTSTASNPPPPPPAHPTPSQPMYPATDRRDNTGTTFGGLGQAMDIDAARRARLCFHCGKAGHFSRFCPEKRSTLR